MRMSRLDPGDAHVCPSPLFRRRKINRISDTGPSVDVTSSTVCTPSAVKGTRYFEQEERQQQLTQGFQTDFSKDMEGGKARMLKMDITVLQHGASEKPVYSRTVHARKFQVYGHFHVCATRTLAHGPDMNHSGVRAVYGPAHACTRHP
ncbi:hypothetical protein Bbelb_406370 [Branchiostoma belcheri]|nr:hypothetical protein Bbelb_406370 [Branchiostoma belcheri]